MPRIRTIKPEFWEDEKIGNLPIPCRLLFIGCWNFADDYGVIRGNASIIKSQIFPYDENLRTSEIKKWLDALVNARMLVPIIHDGESYYYIRTFRSHQILDKRFNKSFIEIGELKELINSALSNYDVNTTCTPRDYDVNTTLEKEEEKEKEEEEEKTSNEVSKKRKVSSPAESTDSKIDYTALMEFFNKTFSGKLPSISKMDDKRKASIRARAATFGKKAIYDVLRNVYNSPFLLGDNEHNWCCSFDWIFKPTNFAKIYEGNYQGNGNRDSKTARKQGVDNLVELAKGVLRGSAVKKD
jgi:hypothetical protein